MVSREEILQAVKLHAAANEGVPLGKKKFETATGFGQSSWYGKYWSRWNDVLIEAGFDPNEWNQPLHTKESVLTRLADFTLELGHYPTKAECNLRHRTDPSMPFDSSIAKVLGPKPDQVRQLMEFAVGRPEYRLVYDICSRTDTSPARQAAADVHGSVPGRVYLLRSGNSFKIGKTESTNRRFREVQLLVPGELEEVHVLETDDPSGIELYWHRRFADKRTKGEWFSLSESDVAAFKRRGSFM